MTQSFDCWRNWKRCETFGCMQASIRVKTGLEWMGGSGRHWWSGVRSRHDWDGIGTPSDRRRPRPPPSPARRRPACQHSPTAYGRFFGNGRLISMATALYLGLVISQHRRSITSTENSHGRDVSYKLSAYMMIFERTDHRPNFYQSYLFIKLFFDQMNLSPYWLDLCREKDMRFRHVKSCTVYIQSPKRVVRFWLDF